MSLIVNRIFTKKTHILQVSRIVPIEGTLWGYGWLVAGAAPRFDVASSNLFLTISR